MNENVYQYNIPILELDSVTDVEKLLLPHKEYSLFIHYPLAHPQTIKIITGSTGITKNQLGKIIKEEYIKIYEQEVSETGLPVYNYSEPKRHMSHGRYGVWGYDIEDLWLNRVEIDNLTARVKPIVTTKIKTNEYKYN